MQPGRPATDSACIGVRWAVMPISVTEVIVAWLMPHTPGGWPDGGVGRVVQPCVAFLLQKQGVSPHGDGETHNRIGM
jgi:hypothetical protein